MPSIGTPEIEERAVDRGRVLGVDARRAAGENDRARPHGADLLEGERAGVDLAVDALLADAPRDELGVLRAEVEDEDEFADGRHARSDYQPRPGRQATATDDQPRRHKPGNLPTAMLPDLRIQVTRVGAVAVPVPAYQTVGAAGMDLHAAIEAHVTLPPLGRVRVRPASRSPSRRTSRGRSGRGRGSRRAAVSPC